MTWRLLLDGPTSGAQNMARDEAILLVHPVPTLRFYSWNPACLSLGRLQKFAFPANVEVVRRPTGGRAVWHQHEITYCAVVKTEFLPDSSVMGAYNWLSQGFLEGLKLLGIAAELAPAGVRTAGTNCFAASAGCDFLAGGKKLLGAAQCRKDDAILQHGSLLLSIDLEAWAKATGGEMSGAISLEELGVEVSREAIIGALVEGFQRAHNLSLKLGEFLHEETQVAKRLHDNKYSSGQWTQFGRWADTPERLHA